MAILACIVSLLDVLYGDEVIIMSVLEGFTSSANTNQRYPVKHPKSKVRLSIHIGINDKQNSELDIV